MTDLPNRPLRVTEAARALGVHPNTVRNWVAIGRLSDVRVRGTSHLRLDPDQVASLMHQAEPLIEGGTATFRLYVPQGVDRIVVDIVRLEP